MEKAKKRSSDYAGLGERLDELDITVSKNGNGGFTVFTTCEPLFCFERSTLAEINRVVTDTLRSYIEAFYNVKNVAVSIESEDIPRNVIPQKVLTPISKIKPSIPVLVGARA